MEPCIEISPSVWRGYLRDEAAHLCTWCAWLQDRLEPRAGQILPAALAVEALEPADGCLLDRCQRLRVLQYQDHVGDFIHQGEIEVSIIIDVEQESARRGSPQRLATWRTASGVPTPDLERR